VAIDDVKIIAKGLFQYESIFILLPNTQNENPLNPRYPFHHNPHACQVEEIPFLAPSIAE